MPRLSSSFIEWREAERALREAQREIVHASLNDQDIPLSDRIAQLERLSDQASTLLQRLLRECTVIQRPLR